MDIKGDGDGTASRLCHHRSPLERANIGWTEEELGSGSNGRGSWLYNHRAEVVSFPAALRHSNLPGDGVSSV